jgi:uncharacterized protein YbjT (DUF2867 family)
MAQRLRIGMLMLHHGTPRDQQARAQLAEALPPRSEVTEPDEVGAFEVEMEAADQEDALTQIWDAVAASGTDDHIVFLEHPTLPEHWRRRAGRARRPGRRVRGLRSDRMDVVIVGAHGKVARRLARLLVARGDRVRGVIRNPAHVDDLRADGSEPVVCDLERVGDDELAGAISGADAVVFAAGAGPGSGAERKLTVDRDGAIKLLHAARAADVERYVMVSSIGAEDPPDGDDVFAVYLRAKAEADRELMASDRAWTVVRPVFLQDEQGTGRIRLAEQPLRGKVPRDDVAGVLAAVLHEPRSARRVLYVSAGDDPIEEALARVL